MHPYVLAVTGASAQPLAERALQLLLQNGRAVHLVLSHGAHEVFRAEQGLSIPVDPLKQKEFWRDRQGRERRTHLPSWNDQAACIASGSYRTRAMVIVPAAWEPSGGSMPVSLLI